MAFGGFYVILPMGTINRFLWPEERNHEYFMKFNKVTYEQKKMDFEETYEIFNPATRNESYSYWKE